MIGENAALRDLAGRRLARLDQQILVLRSILAYHVVHSVAHSCLRNLAKQCKNQSSQKKIPNERRRKKI